jgi:aldehyde:ferredoxin oxidoreductase
MRKMEYYGYAGAVLYVDLSAGDVKKEPLDIDLAKKFIGGPGIGYNLLYKVLKPSIDPLSSENPIIIGTGPLIGTLTPGAGKVYLTMKFCQPASKREKKYIVSRSTGGSRRFGVMMKNAGYDHIVITGRAEKPSYLKIIDDDIEICDASNILGKDVYETNAILTNRHRGRTGKCGVWTTGPAGENLVRSAHGFLDGVLNTLGRYAGAVLGSKNLKAIVTLGTKGIKIKDKRRFMDLYNKKVKQIIGHPKGYQWELKGLFGETMVDMKGCAGCISPCKSIHEVKEGRFKGAKIRGIYFGVAPAFGLVLGLENDEMFKLIDFIVGNGLDLITTIRMIYFVTRLYERGIISAQETGGLVLKRGDLTSYTTLVEKIVNKEDIGAIMAEGWYPLSEKVGVDASAEPEDGAPIIKGVDVLVDARFWPPHFSPSMGLAQIVHSKAKHSHCATYWARGEDLHRDTYWPEIVQSLADVRRDVERMGVMREELDRIFTKDSFNFGRLEKYAEDAETAYDCLGVCSVVAHMQCDPTRDMSFLSELYSAVTGFNITPRELLRTGERTWNLERLFNTRMGFTREDDEIPSVWLQGIETPFIGMIYQYGHRKGFGEQYLLDWFERRITKEDIERMLDDYYEERGWDIGKGVPTKRKLIELGLEEFAEIVEAV